MVKPETIPDIDKMRADPFYGSAYERYPDQQAMIEAGYFDTGLPLEGAPHAFEESFVTPLNKLRLPEDGGRVAILYTTGAFAPIHNGHLAMMEQARAALEKQGIAVAGGYFAPGHDSYVSHKLGDEAAMPIEKRLWLGQLAVTDSDWLMVDPWPGHYAAAELNFTETLTRFEAYLAAYAPDVEADIYYVFGADNAAFARAFVERGQAVCVLRPGQEEVMHRVAADPILADGGRTLFVMQPTADENISSTKIRARSQDALPERVKEALKAEPMHAGTKADYVVRDDLAYALKRFADVVPPDRLERAHDYFLHGLRTLLEGVVGMHVRVDDAEEQQTYTDGLAASGKVLNLDVVTRGGFMLGLCRKFAANDGQVAPAELIERPGYLPISEQIKAIPPGDYVYLDDDIASGRTLDMLKQSLPPTVRIKAARTLLEFSSIQAAGPGETLRPIYDIVDSRDFLVGSQDGGLVVTLADGMLGRAPYMLPYVSLISRAKIPSGKITWLSKELWRLNGDTYEALLPEVSVGHCDPAIQRLFISEGFKADTPLADVCRWYEQQLALIKTVQ